MIFCKIIALSGVGFVFGIGQIVVKPPATALSLPVLIVSLCSNPGSLKWQCISIIPGMIFKLVQSMILSAFSLISFSIFMILSFSIKMSFFSFVFVL